jgi:hypothetical protein
MQGCHACKSTTGFGREESRVHPKYFGVIVKECRYRQIFWCWETVI